MTDISNKAFILAAGMGSRLRPYTDDRPKPMVEVRGQPLIRHLLDRFKEAGLHDVRVNMHYQADILHGYLQKIEDMNITTVYESRLLDTGGSLAHNIDYFAEKPHFVVNGDAFWEDNGEKSAIDQLFGAWHADKMDILLLLQPVDRMVLTQGVGDYNMDETGRLTRTPDKTGAYMFTSLRVHHPRIFEGCPSEPFSYLTLMDEAQSKGRLYGVVYDGDWHHISTPEDLDAVNKAGAHEHELEDQAHG